LSSSVETRGKKLIASINLFNLLLFP